MKKVFILIAVVAITLITAVSINSCSIYRQQDQKKENSLKADMRLLWMYHASWTREVIIGIVDGVPGTDLALNRLLQNQVEIGDAIKPYYGKDAGDDLTKLLKIHIVLAGEVVKAAKDCNANALLIENKRWYANADEIAVFLNKINPDIELAEMKNMMRTHLDLTEKEASFRVKKDYAGSISTSDKVDAEIVDMADMISQGIITQYPDKVHGNQVSKNSNY